MKKLKKEIINNLRINSKDVGSSEVQIGLLSEKIDNLTNHFKKNKNDKHSLGDFKSSKSEKTFIGYLKKRNSESYTKILSKLNLRK